MDTLNRWSSKKPLKYTLYLSAIAIFFVLILIPPIIGIITKAGSLEAVFTEPELMNTAMNAIFASFVIGLVVAALDLLAGVPLAWLIARGGKSRWLNVLDTLADLPFVVPTAALGYSLLLFWNQAPADLFGQPFISPGWALVMVLHFTFSFPVVVRVVVGSLMDYKMEYERASRTLGAPPLTASRTVTFPIIKPSLIAAYTLAFARSLSETGATYLVAAGVFLNGPVFIQTVSDQFKAGTTSQGTYEGATVFASLILIVVSLALFVLIRFVGKKMKLPFCQGLPAFEKKLSYKKGAWTRNGVALGVFFIIVLIPSMYVALPAFQAIGTGSTFVEAFTGAGVWESFWGSLGLSYVLAAIVTVLGMALGLPMAILISRKIFGTWPSVILDTLINVPIIVPSIALGVSLRFFWSNLSGVPEFLLLIFAHLAITYPYFVRSMTAAMERISVEMEEASKTLGAKPLTVFKSVVWPITKYSILSGAIIVFTRSVSETGASLAVAQQLQTAPVLIVNWVNSVREAVNGTASAIPGVDSLTVSLACGLLILFSFVILLALRLLTRKERN